MALFYNLVISLKTLTRPNQHESQSLLNEGGVSVKHSTVKDAPGETGLLQPPGEERSEWYHATLV